MGNAMKHLLDGFVRAQSEADAQRLIMRLFQSPLVRFNVTVTPFPRLQRHIPSRRAIQCD